MTDLIQLNDAEIAAVSGGSISQSSSVTATQSNSSSISQTASATNSGAVTASAWGYGALAAAAGAESSNTALVTQANVAAATNSIRFGRH
jgi:hypothetical protein